MHQRRIIGEHEQQLGWNNFYELSCYSFNANQDRKVKRLDTCEYFPHLHKYAVASAPSELRLLNGNSPDCITFCLSTETIVC